MNLVRINRPSSQWSPFNQLNILRNEINRIFEAPLGEFDGSSEGFNTWAPALDLYENKDSLIVTAEVPGLKREDIDISLHEDTLTIAGERTQEKPVETQNVQRAERFYGRFQRTITLPKAVASEQVKAAYKDGILTVTLPKAPEAKPRQIEINVN